MNNPYAPPIATTQSAVNPNGVNVRRIKRFSPIQLGKVLAVLYLALSLVFIPFLLLAALAGPKGSGIAAGFIVVLPFAYSLIGFVSGIIGAFIYNFIVKFTGGVEVEIE
jgi:hypothetical protein